MSIKYNGSFNLIVKHVILFNIFIVAISFVLDFIHHVVDDNLNDVVVDVKDNFSLAHKLGNKMPFDWVSDYGKHISEKLVALKTGTDCIIFQPLHSMLGAHMVFNIVIIERGTPSLHFNRGLELRVDLLLPIECNTKITLWTNHLWSLRIVRHNNHSIFAILIFNVWWWTNRHRSMQRSNMSAILLNTCRNQPKPTTEFTFYSIQTCIPPTTTKSAWPYFRHVNQNTFR